MTLTATLIAIVAVGVAVIYSVLPIGSAWLPRCPVKYFTGYDCPGCGSQTVLQCLLRGDVSGAWDANAFIFFAAPLALLTLMAEMWRDRWRGLTAALTGRWAAMVWLVAIVAWTVIRNR